MTNTRLERMRGSAVVPASGSSPSSGKTRVPIYLNVYDLTPMNDYCYWFGLGIFHSGIEVHDVEYAFGAHDFPTSGVFEVDPRHCPGFTFRSSVLLGTTDMTHEECHKFMEACADQYNGDTYHLISKNCNHFSNDICCRLTGKDIPGWVNRLARIGRFCNCLLPEGLQVTTVTPSAEDPTGSETEIGHDHSSGKNDQDEVPLLTPPNGDAQLMHQRLSEADLKRMAEVVT